MSHLVVTLVFLLSRGLFVSTQTGYFWHVTDFHYDHTYETSMLSCNDKVPNPGNYGDYWCDSPWLLVDDSITNMASIEKAVDFIIWTGDTVAHIADANLSLALNLNIIEQTTKALNKSFPDVPVFASLGNHDFYPSDQANTSQSEIYEKVADLWQNWIQNQTEVEQFKKGGFYLARLAPKLVLLALNTNFYYTSNKLTKNVEDPADQIKWMDSQLEEARNSGSKVIVTGHVPPGLVTPGLVDWFYPNHKTKFVDTLLKYADVIVATHFGHDHSDGFKIMQKDSNAVAQFTAPSVTPWRYRNELETGKPHNPGIRLIQYNRTTGEHINYKQYYINLTDSNTHNKTAWTILYSFNEAYNVTNLSVASLKDIFSRMGHGQGQELANKYCSHALVTNYSVVCTEAMKAEIYCGGLHYDLKEAQNCKQTYLNGSPMHYLSPFIIIIAFIIQAYLQTFF